MADLHCFCHFDHFVASVLYRSLDRGHREMRERFVSLFPLIVPPCSSSSATPRRNGVSLEYLLMAQASVREESTEDHARCGG